MVVSTNSGHKYARPWNVSFTFAPTELFVKQDNLLECQFENLSLEIWQEQWQSASNLKLMNRYIFHEWTKIKMKIFYE